MGAGKRPVKVQLVISCAAVLTSHYRTKDVPE